MPGCFAEFTLGELRRSFAEFTLTLFAVLRAVRKRKGERAQDDKRRAPHDMPGKFFNKPPGEKFHLGRIKKPVILLHRHLGVPPRAAAEGELPAADPGGVPSRSNGTLIISLVQLIDGNPR